MNQTVAIIGGGITGISAALEALALGADVHLFEADSQLGGKVAEVELDGRILPTAPDAFLARRPEMTDLAISLGLEPSLVSPAAGSPRIFRDGSLYPLPPNVLGIPATAELTPGLLSAAGIERLSKDLRAGPSKLVDDESAGALVRRRLGDEALEYLVDPLLGGINAGDSDQLSIMSGVPQLATLRDRNPSLIGAAADTLASAPQNPGPVFRSVSGGLSRMVQTAAQKLTTGGARVHVGSRARIQPDALRWRIESETTESLNADAVVITTPAFTTSQLIATFALDAADALSQIEYSSVALTLLVLPPGTIEIDPQISGVLVPRKAGLHVTAVSFASHKWPALAARGEQILRVSVGRRTHTTWQELTDGELVAEIRSDLAEIFGADIPTGPTHVSRWKDSLPQYDVGHNAKIQTLDRTTQAFDGLALTGAWRSGLGLPACVAAGRTAARNVLGA